MFYLKKWGLHRADASPASLLSQVYRVNNSAHKRRGHYQHYQGLTRSPACLLFSSEDGAAPLGRERPSPSLRLERIFSVYDLSTKSRQATQRGGTGGGCVNRDKEAQRKDVEMSEG